MNNPRIAASVIIATPVYTTMCGGVQNNSGSRIICDIASHIPAKSSMTVPKTARIETANNADFVFETNVCESVFKSFI
jgi:hypothetical protein